MSHCTPAHQMYLGVEVGRRLSDAFGLLKMGDECQRPKRQKGKGVPCPGVCQSEPFWLGGWGALGWSRASRAAVRRGAGRGFTPHDAEQAAADPGQGTRRSGHAGEMRLFQALPPLSFPLLVLPAGESINTARTPVVPERGKTGVYKPDTFRVYCKSFVLARKGSKTLLGEKDDRKTVQGIHRCRMSYGSGGVRIYAAILSWAWENAQGGRASTSARRAMKRPISTRVGSYSRDRKPAYPPDYEWFTLAYKRSDFSWSLCRLGEFQRKRAHRRTSWTS